MIKIPKKFLKPLDYLFIMRPSLFFPIWIIILAGYAAFFKVQGESRWWSLNFDWNILLDFVFITLCGGGNFILNQLQDVDSDKENDKLFLISEKYIHPKIAKKIAYFSIGIALVFFLIQNIGLFILAFLLVTFGGYFYNYQPFAWKDKPIFGLLTNLLVGLFLFLFGWIMAGGSLIAEAFKFSVAYLCAWTSIAILTTIPDKYGDSATGKATFTVQYGDKISIIISFILVIIGFGLGLYFEDPVISHSILLSLPLYVIMLLKQNNDWILRTIRYSILFLACFLCVEFPLFFIALILNFYISKIYYVSRFDLEYPTFKVGEE